MDTGQVDAGRIENQMRETRARLDRKLDALNARSAAARDQGLWAASALAGIVGAVLLIRAGRRRLRRRPRQIALPPQRRTTLMNRYIRSAITVLVMIVALVSPSHAQSSGFSAADSSELASLASLMGGMVAGFQKSGMLKEMPKDLKEVNPENVKFMLDHEAELAEMQNAMEQ